MSRADTLRMIRAQRKAWHDRLRAESKLAPPGAPVVVVITGTWW